MVGKVFLGKGTGSSGKPQGYLWQSLPSTAIKALQSTIQLHTSYLIGSSCLQPQSFIIFNSDQTSKWPSSPALHHHQQWLKLFPHFDSTLPPHWLLLPPTTVICHLQPWSNLCPHAQELLLSPHLTYPQHVCFALCPYNPSHTSYHMSSFHLQLHVTSIDQLLPWCHICIFCLVYISQSDQIWPSSSFILYFHHNWYNRQETQVQGLNQSYEATYSGSKNCSSVCLFYKDCIGTKCWHNPGSWFFCHKKYNILASQNILDHVIWIKTHWVLG